MPKPISKITCKIYQTGEGSGPLTVDQAMELIGWEIVESGGVLKDTEGQWVVLRNNSTNRPFKPGLMKRYLLEMLRGKWKLNGESIIFDDEGKCQSGQHRLVAFIIAVETWRKDKAKWAKYHKKEPTLSCLVVRGIDSSPETVDTIDQGQKRSLGDVFYRSDLFGDGSDTVSLGEGKFKEVLPALGMKQRQRLSTILAHATRLAWLRATDKNVSDAPHFPVSEAVDFINTHPALLWAVAFINRLEGGSGPDGCNISNIVSPGYAAGLCYLMAVSGTEDWPDCGADGISLSMQKTAVDFWEKMASGAELKADDPAFVCRELVKKIDAGSAIGRDEIVTTIVKAFNAFADGKKVKAKDLVCKRRVNEAGTEELVSMDRLGGIDVEGPEIPTDPDEIDEQNTSDDREGDRAEKGKWSPGDSAWVKSQDGQHWFGTVVEFHKAAKGAGQDTVTLEDDKGKQWWENVGRLSIKYPG